MCVCKWRVGKLFVCVCKWCVGELLCDEGRREEEEEEEAEANKNPTQRCGEKCAEHV